MTLERAPHLDTNMALVTGSAARVTDVSLALEKEGFSTYSAPSDALHLGEELRHAALPVRSLNCYVQLPTADFDEGCTGTLAGLRALVANALLARFDALAVVAPRLAPGARLVIVAGDRAGTTGDADLGLPGLSAVLAEAVLARRGPEGVHTTVIGAHLTSADIAAIAGGRDRNRNARTWGQITGYVPALSPVGSRRVPASPTAMLAGFAGASPELSYVDWRDEVLGLVAELSDGRPPSDR
jgi:hypothetical protein